MNVLYYRMVNGYGYYPYSATPGLGQPSAITPPLGGGLAGATPAMTAGLGGMHGTAGLGGMGTAGLGGMGTAGLGGMGTAGLGGMGTTALTAGLGGMGTPALATQASMMAKWPMPGFSSTQIQYMFRPRPARTKVTKPVRCETCSITLNSEQQAKQHFSGKNHLKKVRQATTGGRDDDKKRPTTTTDDEGKEKEKRRGDASSPSSPSSEGDDGGEERATKDAEPDVDAEPADGDKAKSGGERTEEEGELKESEDGGKEEGKEKEESATEAPETDQKTVVDTKPSSKASDGDHTGHRSEVNVTSASVSPPGGDTVAARSKCTTVADVKPGRERRTYSRASTNGYVSRRPQTASVAPSLPSASSFFNSPLASSQFAGAGLLPPPLMDTAPASGRSLAPYPLLPYSVASPLTTAGGGALLARGSPVAASHAPTVGALPEAYGGAAAAAAAAAALGYAPSDSLPAVYYTGSPAAINPYAYFSAHQQGALMSYQSLYCKQPSGGATELVQQQFMYEPSGAAAPFALPATTLGGSTDYAPTASPPPQVAEPQRTDDPVGKALLDNLMGKLTSRKRRADRGATTSVTLETSELSHNGVQRDKRLKVTSDNWLDDSQGSKPWSAAASGDTTRQEVAGYRAGWYHCKACDVSVTTTSKLQQHMTGLAHRQKLTVGLEGWTGQRATWKT